MPPMSKRPAELTYAKTTLSEHLRNVFGWKRDTGPEAEEIKALTDQFYVSLHAYYSVIDGHASDGQLSGNHRTILEKARSLAEKSSKDRTWQDAYNLEQQLVLLYDEPTLETELSRRLVEGRTSLAPEIVGWYEKAVVDAKDTQHRRAILTLMHLGREAPPMMKDNGCAVALGRGRDTF